MAKQCNICKNTISRINKSGAVQLSDEVICRDCWNKAGLNESELINSNKYNKQEVVEKIEKLRSCDICIQPDPFNPLNNVSTIF
jgi:superfamily II helicase